MTNGTQCSIYNEESIQEFHDEVNVIENQYEDCQDIFNHLLINEINQWEEDSIEKIKQTANQCREKLTKYCNKIMMKTKTKLNEIVKQIDRIDDENKLRNKLNELKEELDKTSEISIKQEQSIPFIKKIFLVHDRKWKQNGMTVAGGNSQGKQLNQLDRPQGIFIDDDDETLYIADCWNDRIIEWKANATNGEIVAGGNGRGDQTNQLNEPRDVFLDKKTNSLIICDNGNRRVMRWSLEDNSDDGEIMIDNIDCSRLTMDNNGSLYVSDWKNNEVRRWNRGDTNGTIVAGGNGQGDQLNQLNYPTYVSVDEDYSVYVSDLMNHRIMKWKKDANEGVVLAGGCNQDSSSTQLSSPDGITVDQWGQVYVANWDSHRVMRWCEDSQEGRIILGGNGRGEQSNQFSCPHGLSFDRKGNLYVVDGGNNRIQKFEIDSDQKKSIELK